MLKLGTRGSPLALTTDIVKRYGADSVFGRTAATLYGSSETLFYVLAVYFGAVNVRKTRHAVPAGLLADFSAMVLAVYVVKWMFG